MNINAMTIDVEDYFMVSAFSRNVKFEDWEHFDSRVVNNTKKILDLFCHYDVRGTFFVLGWVAEKFPNLVKEIAAAGHEVACHGYNHRLIYNLTHEEFREDTRRAKKVIEDITGQPVAGYRATSYSITRKTFWALDILMEEGFKYDSSIFPIVHDIYGIKDFSRFPVTLSVNSGSIIEIPMSTLKIFRTNLPIAGGGYFRLLPYQYFGKGIRHINSKENQPVIFYLHPWEIDPDQPVQTVNLRTRLRHYTNLHKTETKFKRLLSDFKWGRVSDVMGIGSAVL